MADGVLDGVRSSAAWVAERAQRVRVREARLADYARSLPLERARAPQLDPATHYVGEPDATLAFVLTLDAINFGSGYFPRVRKRPGLSGYFTVASGLKERFEADGPLTPDELQTLDAAACAATFGQSLEDPAVAELMELFATALRDLGRCVAERHGGSFRALVDAADGSAEQLVAVLTTMPLYRDVAAYEGREVSFYKRAQLTSADLKVAGVAAFDDLERLTIFADNLVPHVLRLDGVLDFDRELVERIEREELIAAGSVEEVEIRACAVHAVELLAAELRAAGEPISPMGLDYVLWNRGQEPAYKAAPRHRARSVYY